jgi:hypothetical protein
MRSRLIAISIVLGLACCGREEDPAPTPAPHVHTRHDGVVAPVRGPDGAIAGYVEVKLHDDKGDLEMWIAKDEAMKQDLDVPLATRPAIEFLAPHDRTVELRVRDVRTNEDEAGNPNVRDGRTSYFIFPGDTGADAAWLKGKAFSARVRVSFTADGTRYVSDEFTLVPHVHSHGDEGEEHR